MTKDKITKQDLFTKLSIVEAKLDFVLDLLQKNEPIVSDLSSYCRDPENKNLNKGTIQISGDLSI